MNAAYWTIADVNTAVLFFWHMVLCNVVYIKYNKYFAYNNKYWYNNKYNKFDINKINIMFYIIINSIYYNKY